MVLVYNNTIMLKKYNKRVSGVLVSISVLALTIFSTGQALAFNLISGGGIITPLSSPLSTVVVTTGENTINVHSCDEVDNGVRIQRKVTGKQYTLKNGTKNAGHGVKTYTFDCPSETQYHFVWTKEVVVQLSAPISSPISSPLSSPLSTVLSSPLSSPLSTVLSSPISAPISTPISAPVLKTGETTVKVYECNVLDNGVEIKRKENSKSYTLKNGIKNTGHGKRDYTFSCVDGERYSVQWTEVAS